MKKLPNGLIVYNATPHPITFWQEGWDSVIIVERDHATVDAFPQERLVSRKNGVDFVRTVFVGTEEGREVIERAYEMGADVIVGSIIAAQAYPGNVVAMTPAPGFERVPPEQKRMSPSKFTIF